MDIRGQRSWMYNRLLPDRKDFTQEFVRGVYNFIAYVKASSLYEVDGLSRCPCRKCENRKYLSLEVVHGHLLRNGFVANYWYWTSHGEQRQQDYKIPTSGQSTSAGPSMGLENRAKLEARLRNLEGKELGHSAGSVKGKPKIEFYDKDQTKGSGGLITPAKTYNLASDSILGLLEQPLSKKEVEAVAFQAEQAGNNVPHTDEELKKKKKKKKKADAEDSNGVDGAEAENEAIKKKEKKKKKHHLSDNSELQIERENANAGEKKK